jgi:spore coat polysaccharide biosynthesis protein SpsF
MKVGIILQARMASTRCPYKIASLVLEKPILYHQIKRIKRFAKNNIPVIVATSDTSIDDATAFIAGTAGALVFRGSEKDVMKRYLDAAGQYKLHSVIRICGDDPLVDPACLRALYKAGQRNKSDDFINASHKNGWMLGTSAEYFTVKALKRAYRESSDFEKEHVVIHFNSNPNKFNIRKINDESSVYPYSFTVDHPDELKSVKTVIEYFKGINFSQEELLKSLKKKKIKLSHKPQFFNY